MLRRSAAQRRKNFRRRVVNDRSPGPNQRVRAVPRRRRFELSGRAGRSARVPGAERRGQDHDDADRRRLLAADDRPRARLRLRHRNAGRRGEAPHRLPARGRAELPRDDAALVPRVHRRSARPRRRASAASGSTRCSRCCTWTASSSRRIDTLSKGYRRRVGPRAGDPARSRGADSRRADRRSRSESETRGARADRPNGEEQDHRDLDAPARRGRSRLQPRDHHRARQDTRRRHAARPRGALAVLQRRVAEADEPGPRSGGAQRHQVCCPRSRARSSTRRAASRRSRRPASCRWRRSTRSPSASVGRSRSCTWSRGASTRCFARSPAEPRHERRRGRVQARARELLRDADRVRVHRHLPRARRRVHVLLRRLLRDRPGGSLPASSTGTRGCTCSSCRP